MSIANRADIQCFCRVSVSFQLGEKQARTQWKIDIVFSTNSMSRQVINKNVICNALARSVILILVLLDVTSLFLHLLFFYYAVHVVVYWQILQFSRVFPLVEDHLELVLHGVWATVLLARRYRWRRKQWIYRDSFRNNKKEQL